MSFRGHVGNSRRAAVPTANLKRTSSTFDESFRNMLPITMRRGRTFRSGRTRPADGQSNNSETLSRIQSLADYTIDTLESSFQKRQVFCPHGDGGCIFRGAPGPIARWGWGSMLAPGRVDGVTRAVGCGICVLAFRILRVRRLGIGPAATRLPSRALTSPAKLDSKPRL